MSPAAPTWKGMGPDLREQAVAELLASDTAPSILAWKLRAPRRDIDRMASVIRKKAWLKGDADENAGAEPEGFRDGSADAHDVPPARSRRDPDHRADGVAVSARKGRPEGGKRLQVLRGPNHAAEPDENAIANGVTGGERAATIPETPAPNSQPVTAPEAAPPPAVSGNLPAAPDPSIPWAMLSACQKQAAVLPLVQKGMTAAAIAIQLRAPSRNSIVGTINRMRQRQDCPIPPARSASASRLVTVPEQPKPAKPSKHLADLPGGKPKTHRYDFKGRAEDRATANGLAPHLISGEPRRPIMLEVPTSRRLQLVDLNDHVCRWPSGDPLIDGFSFCGNATEAAPYCRFHASIAYQSPADRRAERKQERIA